MLPSFVDQMEKVFRPSLRKRYQALKGRLGKAFYMTELMLEELAIGSNSAGSGAANTAIIFPYNNTGTQYCGTVDMDKFNRVTFLCGITSIGTGSNTVFTMYQSNTAANAASNGSGTTAIALGNGTGNAVTLSGANQVATLECRADQLTAPSRYALVQAVVNGANGASPFVVPIAGEPRNHPQNANDPDVIQRYYV